MIFGPDTELQRVYLNPYNISNILRVKNKLYYVDSITRLMDMGRNSSQASKKESGNDYVIFKWGRARVVVYTQVSSGNSSGLQIKRYVIKTQR